MSYTYFARVDGGPLVELDDDTALNLYGVSCTDGNGRPDDMTDEEFITERDAAAKKLFDAGTKTVIGNSDDTYVFGAELSGKDRFELLLKYGTETREEFKKRQSGRKIQ
jgi:hypothetical protein